MLKGIERLKATIIGSDTTVVWLYCNLEDKFSGHKFSCSIIIEFVPHLEYNKRAICG